MPKLLRLQVGRRQWTSTLQAIIVWLSSLRGESVDPGVERVFYPKLGRGVRIQASSEAGGALR